MEKIVIYLTNWIYAIDRLLNVALGGSSKEFVSTRVYNHRFTSRICWYCYKILNWIEPGHCEHAAKVDYDPDHSSDELFN